MRLAAAMILFAMLSAGCLEPDGGADTTTPTLSPSATPTASPSPTPTSTPSSSPSPSPSPPDEIEITELAGGSQSGIREAARRVFTDRAAYESFWADVREDDTEAAPEVDFATQTVVAALAGPKSNACWAIRIVDAEAAGGKTGVEVTTYSPPPATMCASVISHPWHMVALSGAGRDVTFRETTAVGPPSAP